MSVIRIEKNKNYTVMSNYHLQEKKMTLKAKGLMSLMLSLPDKWDYSIAGLVAICKENETSIKSALDELKEFGYLQVIKKMPNETESGRFEYEYVLYETKQEGKKQGVENLGVEFLGVENQGQLNTIKLNTNKINKERVKFTPPTLEEVKEYAESKQRLDLAEKFYEYYTADENKLWCDKDGKKMKSWKQKFLTWCNHSFVNTTKDKNFKGRQYDEKEINAMFQNIDDLVV